MIGIITGKHILIVHLKSEFIAQPPIITVNSPGSIDRSVVLPEMNERSSRSSVK